MSMLWLLAARTLNGVHGTSPRDAGRADRQGREAARDAAREITAAHQPDAVGDVRDDCVHEVS